MTLRRFRGLCCLLLVLLALPMQAVAQCMAKNTAFQAGEVLNYSLFFNWKFIWVNAGTASMTINDSKWEGRDVFRCHLMTTTSKRLDRFFMMRDTLLSVVTPDLQPVYYKKGANEGGKYYLDQVWYSRSGGKTKLKQSYKNAYGNVTERAFESADCVYDMLSMMLRARSFDASVFKKGDKLRFLMADGDDVDNITLIYRGRENFTMRSSGVTYRCLVFSFVEYEDKKEKEIITFYISDDYNHIPVRLDLFLRFGTAKAYLDSYKGLRHECTSIVK